MPKITKEQFDSIRWPNMNEGHLDNIISTLQQHENNCEIETSDSKVFQKLKFLHSFHEKVYSKNEDFEKSRMICTAFENAIEAAKLENSKINNENLEILKLKIIKYSEYIGFNNDIIKKIFEQTKKIRNILNSNGMQSLLLTIFLENFYQNLSASGPKDSSFSPVDPNEYKTIIIGTASTGGAHISIANVIQAKLSKINGYIIDKVDETELYNVDEDPLKTCIGIAQSKCHNEVGHKKGNFDYKNKLKDLARKLYFFIPNPRPQLFRDRVGKAHYFFSTSHHGYNVRFISEHIKRLCFQICDFGKISENLDKIVKVVIKYSIESVRFFAPSDSSYFSYKNDRLSFTTNNPLGEQFKKHVVLTGYPVNEFCKQILKKEEILSEINPYLQNSFGFSIRPEAYLILMVMGQQGVVKILEPYIGDIIKYNWEKMIDVVVVCGKNNQLKNKIAVLIPSNLNHLLKIHLIANEQEGIPNDKLIKMGKYCNVFITKPGGGTIAEGIYSNFPLLIHKTESSWEIENLDEAKKRVNAQEIIKDRFCNQIDEMLSNPTNTLQVNLPENYIDNFIEFIKN